MRRIPAVVLLCLGIALAGAAPARPSKPTPTPSPAATLQPVSLPIVVVFPFGTSSDIAPGNGEKAANLFVQVMNSAGGIDTIDAAPNIKRSDYLTYARNIKADYYVSGYMTPLGNGVSLVEQVVSTRSGVMIFGQTAQIESFQDASSQAIAIHDGIMSQLRDQQQYQAAQASATPTPMANNQANIGKGIADIAGLFKHNKSKAAAPTVVANKPAKGVYVARVNGSVPANNLSTATSALYYALNDYYHAHMTRSPGLNLAQSANAICGTNRDNTVATGMLSATSSRHMFTTHTQWTFKLQIYTCWGALLAERTETAGSLNQAVTQAVMAYAKAHPKNS